MIKKLEDLEYYLEDLELYMNIHTGSVDTGENWKADFRENFKHAVQTDLVKELGYLDDWRESLVHVDANGQEIE